jgi:outer membrane protein insertion porin family
MIGGAVNSDAGVTGQITLDERNFDITRYPRSFSDIFSGRAWRGAGQSFRLEAVPGNRFQRYTASFGEPYLFGYLPISFNVNGFLYNRRFRDYDEERVGGRFSFGYRVTPDLTLEVGLRGEQVDFQDPRVIGIPEVDRLVGDHDLYGGQVRLTYDTRDIAFAPTQGHLLSLEYEQIFGSFDFPRFNARFQHFELIRQRPDGSGRHTLSFSYDLGISGEETPIFENYFAGGYSTLRGFAFRGASPTVATFQVGGRFRFLGSAEYQFPLTADDMFKGVLFVDYGTVEREIDIHRDNIRVAPGFGFRVAIPAMGPAPLAFDFGFPIAHADTDDRQVFSFFLGFNR